jgi:hypothetical protein
MARESGWCFTTRARRVSVSQCTGREQLCNRYREHLTHTWTVPRPGWAPDPLMVGIRSPDGLVVGLAPATLEFWVRFPNDFPNGDFVEQIGNAVMELAMSKGVGSTFKEIILALCSIVEWIYNNIWARIMCPITQFMLEFVSICIDVWETIVNVLRTLSVNVDILISFIEFVRGAIAGIASSLNKCTGLPANVCVLASPVSGNTTTQGTLPMPT